MTDYDEHLERALDETPDSRETSERFDVPTPETRQEGNVTVYENFRNTVNDLSREADHVLTFLQNELGTSAQLDESGRARLTGSFNQRRIETAVEEYIDRFVVCPECGLPDTRLERKSGVVVLRCEACGARSATNAE